MKRKILFLFSMVLGLLVACKSMENQNNETEKSYHDVGEMTSNETIAPIYIYGEEMSIDITDDEKSELCVSYLINRDVTAQVNYIQGNIVSMNDYKGGVLITIRFVGVSNQNDVYGELVLPSDGTWHYTDEKMNIGDSITIGYIGQLKGIQEENSYYGDIIWCEIDTHVEVITSVD